MDLFAYFLVFIASVGLVGLGRAVLPGTPFGRAFLVGVAFSASIAGSLGWFAPLAVIPACRLLVVVGWGIVLWNVKRWRDVEWARPTGPVLVRIGLAIILAVAVTISFNARFVYVAESNYFLAPLVEYFLADYFGPVRVTAYYPWETAGSHLLGSAGLAAMAALLPKATMLDGLELRFLLLTYALARFCYAALRGTRDNLLMAAAVLAVGLLAFNAEINISIRYSTFFYIALAFELAVVLVFDDGDQERNARDALFLLMLMTASKASIFLLPALTALWLVARWPRLMVNPSILVPGLIAFAHLVLTALQPVAFSDMNIKLSLFNPNGGRATLDYFAAMGDGLISNDTLPIPLSWRYSAGAISILALVVLKLWWFPIRAADNLSASMSNRREILRVAEVFLLVALIDWILVRHNHLDTSLQIWLFYGSAPVVLALLMARATRGSGQMRWKAGLAVYAILVVLNGNHPWLHLKSRNSPHLGGVGYDELRSMTDAEALAPRPNDAATDICDRALLRGLRIQAGDVPFGCLGTLRALTLEPKSK